MRGLNECQYGPIAACTRSIRSPTAPVSYHCARRVVVRDGSAILTSEFGEKPVRVGDVIALAPDTPCGSEPEGTITITTVYLDHDYIVDQVFWQHSALLADRWTRGTSPTSCTRSARRFSVSVKTVSEGWRPG